jgi:hypothetical protein
MYSSLVGIEVFSKLFHLIQIHGIKNRQDTPSKVFRQSPGVNNISRST